MVAMLVGLAVVVIACSETVDILDCDTKTRPLGVTIGSLGPS